MGGRRPWRCPGWAIGAAFGAAAVTGLNWVGLQRLAHAGWAMGPWDVTVAYATAVAFGGSLGAILGAVSDWGERLREHAKHAELGAAADGPRL